MVSLFLGWVILLLRTDDGREPLCNFLGSQFLMCPFPKGNNMKVFQEKIIRCDI